MNDRDPQQLAARSPRSNLLVIAPPGCGKTELLALRAEALISRLRPHQRILALTFTNRAKANLSERLKRQLGVERFRRYVTVHNFHGHAAEIVLAHGRTLGIDPDELKMPTSKTLQKSLKAYASHAATRRAAADLLAEVKRSALSDDEVVAELDRRGDALAKHVEIERAAAHQLHYEDLLRHGQRLLQIDEVANLYHQHYGAVLVDEFQDLSLQQLDIALRSSSGFRTFAGDPLQGIYSWAGAAPAEVQAALEALCGEPIQLRYSYRSSPAVLAMVNAISGGMGAVPLQSHDPSRWLDGGVSAAFTVAAVPVEAEFIARVSQWIVESDPTASVGVITRSGWRRGEIDKAFASMTSVPCRRWDLAVDDPSIVERLRLAVSTMRRDVSIAEAKERIIAGIDPSDVDTIEQVEDAFEQLAAGHTDNIRTALAQLRVRHDDMAVGPGVHLLNAHTGKGQQFDWVFVPGLEEGHLPDRRSTAGSELEEETRVLLVMLSRAKHGVIVTKSAVTQGQFGPYSTKPSRWWAGLAASATMSSAAFDAHLRRMRPTPSSL